MNKEIKYDVLIKLPAKNATPIPPISTVLGPSGINLTKFCEDFNGWSKDRVGFIETGVIIYDDLSYDILTKEQYLTFKNSEFTTVISASPLYKDFKEDEDRRFHR